MTMHNFRAQNTSAIQEKLRINTLFKTELVENSTKGVIFVSTHKWIWFTFVKSLFNALFLAFIGHLNLVCSCSKVSTSVAVDHPCSFQRICMHFTTKQENFPFVKQRTYFDQSYDKLQYGGIAILSKLTRV